MIINIYIAPILFSAKCFTMLQKGLDPRIIYIYIYTVTKIQNKEPKIVRKLA